MNLLGIDYGSRRIGLALANTEARLASPLRVLPNTPELLNQLQQIITTEQIERLILGLPRGLEGQETVQTKEVQAFGHRLRKTTGLPLEWQDEALTSVVATQSLKGKKRGEIDSEAAAIILQDYLGQIFE